MSSNEAKNLYVLCQFWGIIDEIYNLYIEVVAFSICMETELKTDSNRHIVCKLQYNVLYLSTQIKIYNYGTGNIINESR